MYKRVVKKCIKLLEATIAEKRQVAVSDDEIQGWTEAELKSHLDKIPLRSESVVFIHSGFKSLGAVQGGPQAVVNAIIKSMVEDRGITVAMPAFTISRSMLHQIKSKDIFDVRHSKTVFRGIPLTFQESADIKRSIHPTHSVMAVGPKAEWLVGEHHSCGSTFGAGSPYGKLLETQSYIMGLGTRLGTVTFYHALEDMEKDFPFRVYTADSPYTVSCIDYEGNRIKMAVSAHDPDVAPVRIDKPKGSCIREIYASVFERVAGLKYYEVGHAKTWIIDAKQMYEAQKVLTYAGLSIYSSENTVGEFLSNRLFASEVTTDG